MGRAEVSGPGLGGAKMGGSGVCGSGLAGRALPRAVISWRGYIFSVRGGSGVRQRRAEPEANVAAPRAEERRWAGPGRECGKVLSWGGKEPRAGAEINTPGLELKH